MRLETQPVAQKRSSGHAVAPFSRVRPSCCWGQIEVLQRVGHHNGIISLLDAFETPTHVELVMELMEGGELYGRIASKGAIAEPTARIIARRLVDAIKFLHKNNIVHRDLKPENILMANTTDESDVKVRRDGLLLHSRTLDQQAADHGGVGCAFDVFCGGQIADFGLAKLLVNQTRMSTVCGTWAYSAPEVRIFRQMYDSKVDIWSLGVIMFTMYGTTTRSIPQDNV